MNIATFIVAALLISLPACRQHGGTADVPLLHTRSEFHFDLHASFDVAVPLFGPNAERSWGGHDWNPTFVYPLPAADTEGAVFTVEHGRHRSVWVMPVFDLQAGHIQYVYVMDDLLLTRIDIRVTRAGADGTNISVVYERTALKPEGNEHVRKLGETDAGMGEEWATAINGYLDKLKR